MNYSDWLDTCESVFETSDNILNKYLQLYPFSRLNVFEKDDIKSKDFFDSYIRNGFIFSLDSTYEITERFIQKGNGSFRKTYLISPILYLYLLAIGKQISVRYRDSRSWNTDCYYAADFNTMDVHYKKSYNDFLSSLNAAHSVYKYYIKIDFSNYFNSLDVDKIFGKIDKQGNIIDARTRLIYTTFIKIIGNGRFPTVDSNGGLSYVATTVNLDEFDTALETFFNNNTHVNEYHLVRYVDDLYMFFSSDDERLPEIKKSLTAELANLVAENDLQLNERKQVMRKSTEIREDIKNCFYDFFVNGEAIEFNEYYSSDELISFLSGLSDLHPTALIEDYQTLLKVSFEKEDIQNSVHEVINNYIYNNQSYFIDVKVKQLLENIVENNYQVLKYDVKSLLPMVLNTEDSNIIRTLLKKIFISYQNDSNDYFDELILSEYLLNMNFEHEDLRKILSTFNISLSNYIKNYCANSMLDTVYKEKAEKIYPDDRGGEYTLLLEDHKLNFMYLMHKYYSSQNSILEAYAYYRNYFDRFIAHTMNCLGIEPAKNSKTNLNKKSKPNFNLFYKEVEVKKYLHKIGIDEFDDKLKEAFDLRNKNPVNHSSAEILDDNEIRTSDYEKALNNLQLIIDSCREIMTNKKMIL